MKNPLKSTILSHFQGISCYEPRGNRTHALCPYNAHKFKVFVFFVTIYDKILQHHIANICFIQADFSTNLLWDSSHILRICSGATNTLLIVSISFSNVSCRKLACLNSSCAISLKMSSLISSSATLYSIYFSAYSFALSISSSILSIISPRSVYSK